MRPFTFIDGVGQGLPLGAEAYLELRAALPPEPEYGRRCPEDVPPAWLLALSPGARLRPSALAA